MSRAYRIKVSESLKRVLHARDGVSTQLELLPVLAPEQIEQLLAAELVNRGYELKDNILRKKLDGGIVVTVDPKTATVTVQVEDCAEVELKQTKEGRTWVEQGRKQAENALREEVQQDLAKRAESEEAKLQAEVTERLEAVLVDLRKELDQVVNRVTAEALKIKAAQLGQIKELTEDPQNGSMTIVLEV